MSLAIPNSPSGNPAFALSEAEVATILDLVCRGASGARAYIQPEAPEVDITKVAIKEMRRARKTLNITNLDIYSEFEHLEMLTNDPKIRGRIDISFKFGHQIGDEDAYVAVECKRVAAGRTSLNHRYVTNGIARFSTGKYSEKHEWAFMLGYVIKPPVGDILATIDTKIRDQFGSDAALKFEMRHPLSLAVRQSELVRAKSQTLKLKHIFVEMH